MDQLGNAYGIRPSDHGADYMVFIEKYYSKNGGPISIDFRYEFQPREGLAGFTIVPIGGGENRNELILEYAEYITSKINGRIIQQEVKYRGGREKVGGGHVFLRDIIFDRLYRTEKDETIRILLEYGKEPVYSDQYHLKIWCISPKWTIHNNLRPSVYRQMYEID